jgi:uncharacterized protein (DUF2336 family)
MFASNSLIAELESSLSQSAGYRRNDILRRLTDLFLDDAESLTRDQVVVFDDVMTYLIDKIERQALIELSGSLAPIDNAPVKVIGKLSRHQDIQISGPVLEKSKVLTDGDLIEIARTKSQDHLAAIAGRDRLAERVTDILVDRGNKSVTHKVTSNQGARFSNPTFEKVATRAETDEDLAEAVAKRPDLPPELFERLVRRATEIVRRRLLSTAQPEMRERITEVLAVVSRQVARTEGDRVRAGAARNSAPRDPERLRARIAASAKARRIPELIDAFAVFCEVPVKGIENIVRQEADEGMLVLGKASGMGWQELRDVLQATMPSSLAHPEDEKELFELFLMLSPASAQRVVRFIKMRKTVSKDEIKRLM